MYTYLIPDILFPYRPSATYLTLRILTLLHLHLHFIITTFYCITISKLCTISYNIEPENPFVQDNIFLPPTDFKAASGSLGILCSSTGLLLERFDSKLG